MVDEEHISSITFSENPITQNAIAMFFLGPSYRFLRETTIEIEGIDNIPDDRAVIFALNHTDRFNCIPLQYKIWKVMNRYTAAWIKGKYYEHPAMKLLFDYSNQIPLPSLGYIIIKDAMALLGRKLEDDEYRLLRDLVDGERDLETVDEVSDPIIQRILHEQRRDFNPKAETYPEYIRRTNKTLMTLVEKKTLEALIQYDIDVIIFPEGTRSRRLNQGKTGLAQFALRHKIPVVPVGSNGSDKVFQGSNPWPSGGRILYRIGEVMTHDEEFKDCQVTQSYQPFTPEADEFEDQFRSATDRIMDRINNLLDPEYRRSESDSLEAGEHTHRLA